MSHKRLIEDEKGFTFYWKIKQFSLFKLSQCCSLDSPIFLVHQLDKTEWRLNLEFKRDNNHNDVVFNISRANADDGADSIDVRIKLFLVLMEGYKITEEHKSISFKKNFNLIKSRNTFLKEADFFLPDDILTVGCFMKKPSINMSESIVCSAFTEMSLEKILFEIPINVSQPFKFETLSETSVSKKYPNLKINFQLSCFSESSECFVKIEMAKANFEVLSKCKLSARNAKNETVFITKDMYKFKANKEEQVWEVTNSVTLDKIIPNFFKDCYFVLLCDLIVSDGTYSSRIDNLVLPYPDFPKKLQYFPNFLTEFSLKKNLKCLLSDGRLCDFTLRIDDKDFPIHKVVLGAVSPVFCAMFESEMKEREDSLSAIKEIEPNTLKKVIDFAYTENVEILDWENAVKLYVAADRYEITGLMNCCSKWMIANLTTENITEVFTISDMHQDETLERAAVDFSFVHAKEIFRSENWKTFIVTKVVLANKIFQEICIRLTANLIL